MSPLLSAATRFSRQIATGCVLDPPAPAGGLARAVAGAPENAGEDVRIPVDHVGVGIAPVGDHADVFRHRRVRRARPLAIDDLVKIVGDAISVGCTRLLLRGRGNARNPALSQSRRSARCGCSRCGCRLGHLSAAPYNRPRPGRHLLLVRSRCTYRLIWWGDPAAARPQGAAACLIPAGGATTARRATAGRAARLDFEMGSGAFAFPEHRARLGVERAAAIPGQQLRAAADTRESRPAERLHPPPTSPVRRIRRLWSAAPS